MVKYKYILFISLRKSKFAKSQLGKKKEKETFLTHKDIYTGKEKM